MGERWVDRGFLTLAIVSAWEYRTTDPSVDLPAVEPAYALVSTRL